MKHFVLFFAFFFAFHFAQAQSRINYDNFQKTIDESFHYQHVNELSQHWQLQTSLPNLNVGTAIFTPSQVSFLPEGGIRLTATPLANQMAKRDPMGRPIYYKSGMIVRDLDAQYGIFEIVAKIPDGQKDVKDAWPVFKLVGNNVSLSIFDGQGNINSDLRQNVDKTTTETTHDQCGHNWKLEEFSEKWDEEYHAFQAAWTPDAITFFIHGREVSTIKSSQLDAPIESLKLVVALQTNEPSTEPIHFDIKKVTVFTHKEGASFDYMYPNSWEFSKITSELYDTPVMPQTGSIVPNPNNRDEVFYVGTNSKLFQAIRTNGTWSTQQVGTDEILGDLTYLKAANQLIFKGIDGLLHGLERQGTKFIPFKKSIRLALNQKAIATNSNGDIILISRQHQLAVLSSDFTVNAMSKIRSNGDLIVTEGGLILYKNIDNQLRGLRQVDLTLKSVNLPTVQVSPANGSILYTHFLTGKGIAFRGVDNKFHLLTETASGQFRHSIPTYNYGLQDLKHDDFIASNIAGGLNDIFYLSSEGRLLLFGWNHETQERAHFWVDDNWFTEYNLADMTQDAPSLAQGAEGQLFYRTKDGALGMFEYSSSTKGCDCQTIHTLNDGSPSSRLIDFEVLPNPTAGMVKVQLHTDCLDCNSQYELISTNGQIVQKGQFIGNIFECDLSNQPTGSYQLNINSNGQHFVKQIIKTKQ